MTRLRLALLILAAPLAFGCAARGARGGTLAGDVYETRLAVQNLQTYESTANENLSSEIRGLRANQEQQFNALTGQVQDLEQALAELTNTVQRLNAAQGGQEPSPASGYVLPPDREALTPPGPGSAPRQLTPPPQQTVPQPPGVLPMPPQTTPGYSKP
jgi:hypothetical protein